MKRKNSIKLVACVLALVIAMSMSLTGCGGMTLEEYVNENETFKKELEAYSTANMEMTISDNTLSYTYVYDQNFDDETIKLLSEQLKNAIEPISGTFTNIKSALEEETGIKDIVVKVVYADKDDTVIYQKEF